MDIFVVSIQHVSMLCYVGSFGFMQTFTINSFRVIIVIKEMVQWNGKMMLLNI